MSRKGFRYLIIVALCLVVMGILWRPVRHSLAAVGVLPLASSIPIHADAPSTLQSLSKESGKLQSPAAAQALDKQAVLLPRFGEMPTSEQPRAFAFYPPQSTQTLQELGESATVTDHAGTPSAHAVYEIATGATVGDTERNDGAHDSRSMPTNLAHSDAAQFDLLEPLRQGSGAPRVAVSEILRDIQQQTQRQSERTSAVNEAPEAPPPPLFVGQPRGLALLAFMQPEARAVVINLLESLQLAQLSEPALGILIDGTFGYDEDFFEAQIKRFFATPEQKLHLVLYLVSGPTMRRFDSTPIQTPFSTRSPQQFSQQITRPDSDVARAFVEMIERANRLANITKRINPNHQVYVVPVLEDNLSRPAAATVRAMIFEHGRPDLLLVRNPEQLSSLSPSASSTTKIVEFHESSFILESAPYVTALSLDGEGFLFSSEDHGEETQALRFEELESLLHSTEMARMKYMLLWRPEWQGLRGSSQLEHPRLRSYQGVTATQKSELIYLLRTGLREYSF